MGAAKHNSTTNRMPTHDRPPKVFGIGLNKTGTTTLAACLRVLGYSRHSGYRRDLLLEYRKGNLAPVHAVLDEHDSFEDWPYPLLYREIFARYGTTARYVLTMRDSPQAWLASLERHSLRTDPDGHARRLAYGYDYPHGVEAEHLAFYEQHNRAVVAFFHAQGAADVLLEACWERGDGWTKLCRFLEVPTPTVPFPHENKGTQPIPAAIEAENRRRIEQQVRLLAMKKLRPA